LRPFGLIVKTVVTAGSGSLISRSQQAGFEQEVAKFGLIIGAYLLGQRFLRVLSVHDDEPMDAVYLDLQIQIRVGEPLEPQLLQRHDLARSTPELAADLATPRPIFEQLVQPSCFWTGAMYLQVSCSLDGIDDAVHKDAKLRPPRSLQDLQHIRITLITFCNSLQAIPYLASLGNEVVIWIDHQEGSYLFVKLQIGQVPFSWVAASIFPESKGKPLPSKPSWWFANSEPALAGIASCCRLHRM
jgi:hypothetical protein